MLKWFAGLAVAGLLLTAPARAQGTGSGEAPPEFNGKKWYNTAPITLDDLKGKVVHIVVFRTW